MADISVTWTGKWPSLCFGKWVISIDGIGLTGLDNRNFQTEMEYETCGFTNDYSDVEYDYHYDGFSKEKWIKVLKEEDINGLYTSLIKHGVNLNKSEVEFEELLGNLYDKIHDVDFRTGTCGGCL